MVLIDDYLTDHNMPNVFAKKTADFFGQHHERLEFALKYVPDMWYRGVADHHRKDHHLVMD